MINETLTHLKECYDKQTLIIKESEKQIEDANNQKVAILDTFKDSLLKYLSANFTRKWMREIAPYSSKEIYHFVISFEKGSGDSVVAMSSQTLYVSADKTPVVENARYSMCRSFYINCGECFVEGFSLDPVDETKISDYLKLVEHPETRN